MKFYAASSPLFRPRVHLRGIKGRHCYKCRRSCAQASSHAARSPLLSDQAVAKGETMLEDASGIGFASTIRP